MEFSLQYGDPGTNSRSSENGSSRGNFWIGKPHSKVVDSDTLVGALVCEEDEEKGVAIGDETTSGFVVVTTTKTTRTRESVTAIAPPKNARDRTERESERRYPLFRRVESTESPGITSRLSFFLLSTQTQRSSGYFDIEKEPGVPTLVGWVRLRDLAGSLRVRLRNPPVSLLSGSHGDRRFPLWLNGSASGTSRSRLAHALVRTGDPPPVLVNSRAMSRKPDDGL